MSNITNMSDFMKPVNKNPENKLTGVVTPQDQKFQRKSENGFKLLEIINDRSLFDRFDKFTFPEFQVMDNGTIFMAPVKRVIQTLHEYYIKWMILDKDFSPSHDNNYSYVNVPRDGYLVKLIIPVLSENPTEFDIEYVCDINNIHTIVSDSINKMDTSNNSGINMDIKEELTIEPFDPSRYPRLYFQSTDEKMRFFNNYLQNIFDN